MEKRKITLNQRIKNLEEALIIAIKTKQKKAEKQILKAINKNFIKTYKEKY